MIFFESNMLQKELYQTDEGSKNVKNSQHCKYSKHSGLVCSSTPSDIKKNVIEFSEVFRVLGIKFGAKGNDFFFLNLHSHFLVKVAISQ